MNRPTETGVGAEPVSTKLMERMAKQWEERQQAEKREAAACDAAFTAYLAQKEARNAEALRTMPAAK